jgi:small subunit ribosomal protein S16
MAVKIRLARIGKKHCPFYRLVAVDSRQKRDGAFLDNLGTYDVVNSRVVRFEEELYNAWLGKGAQVTPSAEKIHRMYKKDGLFMQSLSPAQGAEAQ